MKLAASQIAFPENQHPAALALLQQYRYTALEVAPTMVLGPAPYDDLPKASIFASKLREEYALAVCSMQSIWYGQQGSLFGKEQAFFLEYTQKAILFAQAVGAGNIVFGCPKNRMLPQGSLPDDAIPFFRQIAKFAAAHGTVFALEANPPLYGTNFLNTTIEALNMAAQVASPGCKLNLDFGTMLINEEPLSLLKGRVGEINHLHISEPNLAMIEKRPAHAELAALLRHEGYQGHVSIEMKQQPLSQLERAINYIAEVFA